MIFVCVGSRQYQFNRLFKELDRLIDEGIIDDTVYAQIGSSDYVPVNFEYSRYMSKEEFDEKIKAADLVVSHGASGSIMGALNAGKKVVAVTRLAKYGEHINDHQIAINESLGAECLVAPVFKMSDLGSAILGVMSGAIKLVPWENENRFAIIEMIDEFIISEFK